MTQEQALKVLKKYIDGFENGIEPFSSYPVNAVFPDTNIRVRADYLHVGNEGMWGIVFCMSLFDRLGENEDYDVCFCDSEEKADTVYGAIKYKG